MTTFIGIDYGTKLIGIAIATTSLAEPLMLLDNDDQVYSKIKNICQVQHADTIVVGLSEGKMAKDTKAFAEKLKGFINLPIVFQDETLTSHEAQSKLFHKSRHYRAKPQDAFQAAFILQRFLDQNQDQAVLK